MNAKQHIANFLVHLINNNRDDAKKSITQAIIMKSRPFINESDEKDKPYYTLAVFDKDDKKWGAQFGDYDRKVVSEEKTDSYSGQRTKILKTKSDQASINAAIAVLNGGKDDKED